MFEEPCPGQRLLVFVQAVLPRGSSLAEPLGRPVHARTPHLRAPNPTHRNLVGSSSAPLKSRDRRILARSPSQRKSAHTRSFGINPKWRSQCGNHGRDGRLRVRQGSVQKGDVWNNHFAIYSDSSTNCLNRQSSLTNYILSHTGIGQLSRRRRGFPVPGTSGDPVHSSFCSAQVRVGRTDDGAAPPNLSRRTTRIPVTSAR
jgi:hypothetical protein